MGIKTIMQTFLLKNELLFLGIQFGRMLKWQYAIWPFCMSNNKILATFIVHIVD